MNQVQRLEDVYTPELWEAVSAQLLTKMIAEFMYEEMISPKIVATQNNIHRFHLSLKNGVAYTFQAKQRLFDSYHVYTDTIYRHEKEVVTSATNPIQFLIDLQSTIGISANTLAHLIREYTQTLSADAHILKRKRDQSLDLTTLDYAELEGEMEGHPWITYNKGRIGFSYHEYLAYAPEQKRAIQLKWVAVHRELAAFVTVRQTHEELIQAEVGAETFAQFQDHLRSRQLDPDHYYYLPIHEWQWDRYLVPLFAEQLAQQRLILLGSGEDWYLPQQSIRTFVNRNHKTKYHVKLPMSILNTLVYRGLPSERTVLAPQITAYIQDIWQNDHFLSEEMKLILPGEVASLNVDHPYYSVVKEVPYQYVEMLGCIWRESIYTFVDAEEYPVTLASLLYVDGRGKPFISTLVEQSTLSLDEWLQQFFTVMLYPLLHYLYRYGVVFSPHGQNAILVLKESVPERLAIKDFVDDVNVSRYPLPELADLSTELRDVLRSEPPEGLCQFIFTGLFIGHFRYLSDLLEVHHGYPEQTFWAQVRHTILQYQRRFPELQARYEIFDLLKPTFTKLCLNRNRILDYGYEDSADRPHASEYGQVRNALSFDE